MSESLSFKLICSYSGRISSSHIMSIEFLLNRDCFQTEQKKDIVNGAFIWGYFLVVG